MSCDEIRLTPSRQDSPVYALRLYKKNGSYKVNQNDIPGEFLLLGHFDTLALDTLQGVTFDNLLSNIWLDKKDRHYLSYQMLLFPLDEECGVQTASGLDKLLPEQPDPGTVYVCCALEVHENQLATTSCKTGIEFLRELKRKILGMLDGIEGISSTVMGVMGSFELLFICASKSVKQLQKAILAVWKMRLNENAVDYSTTFLAMKRGENAKSFSNEHIRLFMNISYSTMTPNNDASKLKDDFQARLGSDMQMYSVTGDVDAHLNAVAPLQNVYLFLDEIVVQQKWAAKLRSVHQSIEIIDEDEPKAISLPNHEPDCELARQLAIQRQVYSQRFEEDVLDALQKAEPLPKTIRNECKRLATICRHMLVSNYHMLTGQRLSALLLASIKGIVNYKSITRESINELIDDIAFHFQNCMRIDSIFLDDIEEFDLTSTLTKMICSYEQMFHSVVEHVNNEIGRSINREYVVFTSIGRTESV